MENKRYCGCCDDMTTWSQKVHSALIDNEVFSTTIDYCTVCDSWELDRTYREQRDQWLRDLGKDPREVAEKELLKFLGN